MKDHEEEDMLKKILDSDAKDIIAHKVLKSEYRSMSGSVKNPHVCGGWNE